MVTVSRLHWNQRSDLGSNLSTKKLRSAVMASGMVQARRMESSPCGSADGLDGREGFSGCRKV